MKTKDIRWIQRFNSYTQALAQLSEFIEKGDLNKFEEQGILHSFECVHDLAWKTLKHFLEHRGAGKIYGSRDATRSAFKTDLIEDGEIWMDMIQSRRIMPEAYDETIARELSSAIMGRYYPAFITLRGKMEELEASENQREP